MMDSILHVYISLTIKCTLIIYKTFEIGGLRFSNIISRALVYCTAVQRSQLRTKWLLCSTRIFCFREFIKTETATAVQGAFRLRFNIQPPIFKLHYKCNLT